MILNEGKTKSTVLQHILDASMDGLRAQGRLGKAGELYDPATKLMCPIGCAVGGEALRQRTVMGKILGPMSIFCLLGIERYDPSPPPGSPRYTRALPEEVFVDACTLVTSLWMAHDKTVREDEWGTLPDNNPPMVVFAERLRAFLNPSADRQLGILNCELDLAKIDELGEA